MPLQRDQSPEPGQGARRLWWPRSHARSPRARTQRSITRAGVGCCAERVRILGGRIHAGVRRDREHFHPGPERARKSRSVFLPIAPCVLYSPHQPRIPPSAISHSGATDSALRTGICGAMMTPPRLTFCPRSTPGNPLHPLYSTR